MHINSKIIILYTLNLKSAVCQLYFNKTGRKNVHKSECKQDITDHNEKLEGFQKINS